MKFDTFLADGLAGAGHRAAAAERQGYDAIWCGEVAHDPLLPLAAAVDATSELTLGTAIALAFARNPMSMAYQAWDLAAATKGRFILGLGTQVKAHITRRFSMPWDRPGPQIRDYLHALGAIFQSFQAGEPLEYAGTHYSHSLLTPMFNPGSLPEGQQPQVALAAVGQTMTGIAGELCDGVLFHPFTNVEYIDSVSLPALRSGAASAGRASEPWKFAYLFLIVGDDDQEQLVAERQVRKQVAFYASTPAYHEVLDVIGYPDLQPELQQLSKQGRWDDMADRISDDLLDHFALRGTLEELPAGIASRYVGRADRLASYFPLPDYEPGRITEFVESVRSHCAKEHP